MWLPIKGKRITREQFFALVEMVDFAQRKEWPDILSEPPKMWMEMCLKLKRERKDVELYHKENWAQQEKYELAMKNQ